MAEQEKQMDRREFLKKSGLVTGGIVGGAVLGGIFMNPVQDEPQQVGYDFLEARLFFDRKEDFAVLMAATERIFPEDDNGPGAIELGVPYFIDKQLYGAWGHNAREYMEGPFPIAPYVREYEGQAVKQSKQGPNAELLPGIPGARYQSRLNRGEIILRGIRQMEMESIRTYNKAFEKLAPEDQDTILQMFESGDVELPGVSAQTFFHLLVQLTIEGAYADPVYGGNKNMDGWRMKEFPGPRAAYINEITDEKFIVMEPQSLKDYQG